ncbi:39S ribosomal protein L38, mitochondrial [Schistosoma japonicum]|nr:39S ribosomal protein L38, mitochondrial [Schistosoma japonicum]KAH8871564.1 39S ribosomal protein L38, mitochondrial [Schistosoma japonicum]
MYIMLSFNVIICSRNAFLIPIRYYLYRRSYLPPLLEPGLYPHPKRQVPECGRKTFEERIKELTVKPNNPSSLKPIDIGLPHVLPKESSVFLKRLDLEPQARKRVLKVPLDVIHSPSEDIEAPLRRLNIAQHYGIFNSLFGPPHIFVPVVNFTIEYLKPNDNVTNIPDQSNCKDDQSTSYVQPVFNGNLISANITMNPPYIDLSAAPNNFYWTLLMTCPDEPVGSDTCEASNEYIHWMVTNLQSTSNDADGDEIIPYMPPLPYQGTGYHRYVFVLYRQDHGKINLCQWKKGNPSRNISSERGFNTLEFYRSLQDEITPAGLVFFQSIWDESVRSYFRYNLNAPEPVFEIQWPDARLPPQEKFPVTNSWTKPRRHPHGIPLIRERYGVHSDVSFDVYLDRYRDRKELYEDIIRTRLANEGNPLDSEEPRRKRYEYPAAIPIPRGMPSWWVKQEMQRRLRRGRWRELDGHDG